MRMMNGREARQISRRRHQIALTVADASTNQCRIFRLPGAQRDIHPLLHQIAPLIGDQHLQRHLGIAPLKLNIAFGQQRGANARRAGDAQPPAGVLPQPCDRLFGTLTGLQQFLTMNQVTFTGKGQAQLARGAIEQPQTQLLLQLANALTDARFWQAGALGRRGKTAAARHQRKQRHILQLLKHDCSPETNAV